MSRPHDPSDPELTAEQRADIKAQRIALGLTHLDCGLVLNCTASNYGNRENGRQHMYESHRQKLMKFFDARRKEVGGMTCPRGLCM